MEVSSQVRDIIDLLSTYTGGRLHDTTMLGRFLQHANDRGAPDSIGDLAFAAKYLTRLQVTMRRQTSGTELYAKLEQEFSRSVHEFHAMVTAFIEDANAEFRVSVQRNHLAVTQEALERLMQLAEDLTWLKNWELEMTQPKPEGKDLGAGARN
ncbi:MAG: hypothetical protein JXA28_11825 [Bacteroidetes bacterium]|nr:hypothetical protein [Bacteroidota bacterium]